VPFSSFVHSVTTGAVLALAGLSFSQARAQSEPPLVHGYVEPCSVAHVGESNSECAECSSVNGDLAACGTRLADLGYDLRCRTGGHSPPGEVWCRKLDAGRPSVRLIASVVAGFVLALAAAFLWARRKRAG
jgi:hypothetical protein